MKVKLLLGCLALTSWAAFSTPVVLADDLVRFSSPITTITPTPESLIRDASVKYDISYTKLYNTLYCESRLDARAIGDGGTSWGIAQIHLPAHPEITKTQALDPVFSINWAALQFSEGRAYEWSCYRLLYQ